jgi:hypothetical protein
MSISSSLAIRTPVNGKRPPGDERPETLEL